MSEQDLPHATSITPIDSGRYGSREMLSIFTDRSRYQFFLQVEAALARAQARRGLIPAEAARVISERADVGLIPAGRVQELEAETRHELVAVLRAFAEVCGEHGRSVHFGATSSDILDTATALQLKHGIAILERKMRLLLGGMLRLAQAHRATPMIGRTHGQHALPITFGFKVAIWADDLTRNLLRLGELKQRVLVGKMSGAVGSLAGWGEHGPGIQDEVMAELGLRSADISNQAVSRDRLAEFIFWEALTAAGLECVATEVRNLQRTEIAEVSEPFDYGGQVGSSAMPHKRNPVLAENVCSLARLMRGLVIPAMENISLWHERDLTNSGNERFTIPQGCVLLDEMLGKMTVIVDGLQVDKERMLANLALSRNVILSEKILLALVSKGIDRKEAYAMTQRVAFAARERRQDLDSALTQDVGIRAALAPEELRQMLDARDYVGHCGTLTDQVVSRCRPLAEEETGGL